MDGKYGIVLPGRFAYSRVRQVAICEVSARQGGAVIASAHTPSTQPADGVRRTAKPLTPALPRFGWRRTVGTRRLFNLEADSSANCMAGTPAKKRRRRKVIEDVFSRQSFAGRGLVSPSMGRASVIVGSARSAQHRRAASWGGGGGQWF